MKGDGELGCLCSFTPARPGGPQSLFPPLGVCFPTRAMLAVRIIAAVSQALILISSSPAGTLGTPRGSMAGAVMPQCL